MRLGEVAPEEKLLADRYVTVRDMRRAALFLVVVARHERVVWVHAEDGARLDCEVTPPRKIHRAGNVVGVLRTLRGQKLDLLLARPYREARPVVLVVVEAEVHGRREENLVVVATVNRDVRPIDHRLDPRLTVHEDVFRFKDGAVGKERKPYRPLEAAAKFRFSDPYCLRTVLARAETPVYRHRSCRAVVMREVPLHAARDPRAEHADERGLDDMLPVECLEASLLVCKVEKMPAMFGKKPHLKPVILQSEILVCLVHLLVVEDVLHRIGIDAPLRPLINAACVEQRRLVIAARGISRKHRRVFLE